MNIEHVCKRKVKREYLWKSFLVFILIKIFYYKPKLTSHHCSDCYLSSTGNAQVGGADWSSAYKWDTLRLVVWVLASAVYRDMLFPWALQDDVVCCSTHPNKTIVIHSRPLLRFPKWIEQKRCWNINNSNTSYLTSLELGYPRAKHYLLETSFVLFYRISIWIICFRKKWSVSGKFARLFFYLEGPCPLTNHNDQLS